MKKFFTVFLFLLLVSSVSFTQPKIGLKAGLNIANVGGDDADELIGRSLDSKTAFAVGVFFVYQFSPLFAVQPEAYYTMKGATYSESGTDLTLTVDYIEIPVLLKLMIPVKGTNLKPAIFAGPSIGFNTTSKSKTEADGQSEEIDLKDDTKSTEFSLQFGGGIGFDVGRNEVGFDIRYILGLTTIDDSSDPLDLKNNVINFNAYYAFSLL